MKLPFQIDLNDKVVVITGAGGLICSAFAEAMAMCGAKVALLDLNEEAAKKYADETSAKFINGVLSQFVTDGAKRQG